MLLNSKMTDLNLVFSHHLVARVYESKAEFRSALQHEKEGYTIYKNQVSHIALLAAATYLTGCHDSVCCTCVNFLRWVRHMRKQRRARST